MTEHPSARARRLAKRVLEWGLTTAPVAHWARRRTRRRVLVLAYHGIIPEGESPVGERSLFVSQRLFGEQLDVVAAMADVISIERVGEVGGERPRVAITFDDAYRGAVTAGMDELRRRALPATIFVAPGRLNGHVFWWDALATRSEVLDASVRQRALIELGGSDERVRDWARAAGIQTSDALPAFARAATVDELRSALASPGITLGSHTWSHPNLSTLAAGELSEELDRPLRWLHEHFGTRAVPWLAYPYGLGTAQVEQASQRAGYLGAFRIDGGWHDPTAVSAFSRPRLNVPAGLSLAGFRARVLGVLGA